MEPLRTCTGCGCIRPQNEMIRIARDKTGNIRVDEAGRADGRGAYVCRDRECVNRLCEKRRLNRAYRTQVEPQTYEYIRQTLDMLIP